MGISNGQKRRVVRGKGGNGLKVRVSECVCVLELGGRENSHGAKNSTKACLSPFTN